MRKVFSALFISMDGVVQEPEKWQFDHFDEDMDALLNVYLADQDAVLMGRVTYDLWAPFWPNSDIEPYASFINSIPKYVVSNTLERADWNNSIILRGDVASQIAKLKSQPGKSIGVQGSPTLVRWLLENDLLDELTLMVHPVIAGSGKHLFQDGSPLKRMQLTNSQTTRTGVALLTYTPRPA